jgi:O-acetyl-ADP-ribose deacetylase (regulator of RNase III)
MSAIAPLVDTAIAQVRPLLQEVPPAQMNKIFAKALAGFTRGTGAKADAKTKRAALRGLYIAMPAPMCEMLPGAAIAAYEAVLKAERDADEITHADKIPQIAPGISVWQGDMSRLRADAVVNPCNNALLGCFLPEHKCLDNILHGAAGPRLRIQCAKMLRDLGISEDVNGQCRVTPGYELPATSVFHTVGPCLIEFRSPNPPRAPTPVDRAELRSCYETCYKAAMDMGVKSLAFCCISTGIFGYPAEEAAAIAVSTVRKLQEETRANGAAPPHVIFNVFKDEDRDIYGALVPRIIAAEATAAAAAPDDAADE